jgi:hypothetical protein
MAETRISKFLMVCEYHGNFGNFVDNYLFETPAQFVSEQDLGHVRAAMAEKHGVLCKSEIIITNIMPIPFVHSSALESIGRMYTLEKEVKIRC